MSWTTFNIRLFIICIKNYSLRNISHKSKTPFFPNISSYSPGLSRYHTLIKGNLHLTSLSKKYPHDSFSWKFLNFLAESWKLSTLITKTPFWQGQTDTPDRIEECKLLFLLQVSLFRKREIFLFCFSMVFVLTNSYVTSDLVLCKDRAWHIGGIEGSVNLGCLK